MKESVCPIFEVGVPHPTDWKGGYPNPGPDKGYPIPDLDRGVPNPRSGWGVPPCPGQVLGQDTGYLGYPPGPGLDGGIPIQVRSQVRMEGYPGVPPLSSRTGWGYPPPCWETEKHSEHVLRRRNFLFFNSLTSVFSGITKI